ncbi:hypothetical protein VFPPC_16278 [Pochonia chlamydosporia 170]|uniref:Uncharacterized protein n=1 Tax=Pochonia chlamydosporia 170 TaxID=1380566 RepID=A0A179FH28_METCM|nr:hypothetical protein VFPPC_16278 [Pochonia chlamydosporia 170]OAQ64915.1 hypothetical protein VFPPC_16278 [Pochonia chlamydosporia 170]
MLLEYLPAGICQQAAENRSGAQQAISMNNTVSHVASISTGDSDTGPGNTVTLGPQLSGCIGWSRISNRSVSLKVDKVTGCWGRRAIRPPHHDCLLKRQVKKCKWPQHHPSEPFKLPTTTVPLIPGLESAEEQIQHQKTCSASPSKAPLKPWHLRFTCRLGQILNGLLELKLRSKTADYTVKATLTLTRVLFTVAMPSRPQSQTGNIRSSRLTRLLEIEPHVLIVTPSYWRDSTHFRARKRRGLKRQSRHVRLRWMLVDYVVVVVVVVGICSRPANPFLVQDACDGRGWLTEVVARTRTP